MTNDKQTKLLYHCIGAGLIIAAVFMTGRMTFASKAPVNALREIKVFKPVTLVEENIDIDEITILLDYVNNDKIFPGQKMAYKLNYIIDEFQSSMPAIPVSGKVQGKWFIVEHKILHIFKTQSGMFHFTELRFEFPQKLSPEEGISVEFYDENGSYLGEDNVRVMLI
jgi:hypothetical protein